MDHNGISDEETSLEAAFGERKENADERSEMMEMMEMMELGN